MQLVVVVYLYSCIFCSGSVGTSWLHTQRPARPYKSTLPLTEGGADSASSFASEVGGDESSGYAQAGARYRPLSSHPRALLAR